MIASLMLSDYWPWVACPWRALASLIVVAVGLKVAELTIRHGE